MRAIPIFLILPFLLNTDVSAQTAQSLVITNSVRKCLKVLKPAVLKEIESDNVEFGEPVEISELKQHLETVNIDKGAKAVLVTTSESYEAGYQQGEFIDMYAVVFNPKTCALNAVVYLGEQ